MAAEEAPTTERDRNAPLRADVSYLGRLLGDVLVEQGGQGLLDAEEAARALSKARTMAVVFGIVGVHDLLDDKPFLRRSIELRNPYIDPLHYIQVRLLRDLRAGGAGLEYPLLLTVSGIATGLRNTG